MVGYTGRERVNPYATGSQTAEDSEQTTAHTITVKGLKAGARYFYRVYDPGATPTSEEANWGASDGYRREYAVSTEAAKGEKTIIHLPVKVLLMTNVINVESAYANGSVAPEPPKVTAEQIQKIKDEYAVSSRFFWVNSGMRLWVDYQIQVDERWERWGPEPAAATGLFKGLPMNRSYDGKDYSDPGGGGFTIVDTADPLRVNKEPVVEAKPFSGQIEMAWLRRWNPQTKQWEFRNSGGGTYGVEQFPQGIPGRSQFLGGGDSAWLATHEFHHDLESHGQFSLSYREDERVVFNHYAARHRTVNGQGSADEMTWSTSGRHGEHWDGMAFWDRTLTDAQWLRFYFGYTTTTKDTDGDGVPDDDVRLPLDEKRFGSNPRKAETDGELNDLQKIMLSTWAPGPLQTSWIKPPFQGIKPNPTNSDTDGDGLNDSIDPYPLYPYDPVIVPMRASVDGDPKEWSGVPVAGVIDKGGIQLTWKQSHDEAGYYGLLLVKGPWQKIAATFDGEGLGVYSGVGVQGFEVTNTSNRGPSSSPTPGPITPIVDVRPTFGKAPGLQYKASLLADGTTAFEFSFPNRGEGIWYWEGGGREIGSVINVFDRGGSGYSVYEPYRIFYSRMLEAHGKVSIPDKGPDELQAGPGVQVFTPGDPKLVAEKGWTVAGGVAKHEGDESALYVGGLRASAFDLLVTIEAKSDAILGGFTAGTKKMTAGDDYVAFVGGYDNRVTKLRLFGHEVGSEPVVMTPGIHRIQLTRRSGEIWLLVDGKVAGYSVDPNPKAVVNRLAVLGGYGGEQVVHEVRIRL